MGTLKKKLSRTRFPDDKTGIKVEVSLTIKSTVHEMIFIFNLMESLRHEWEVKTCSINCTGLSES